MGTDRLMRAPATTGGATAFVTATLADELPPARAGAAADSYRHLNLAETSEAFDSASAVVGNERAPGTFAESAELATRDVETRGRAPASTGAHVATPVLSDAGLTAPTSPEAEPETEAAARPVPAAAPVVPSTVAEGDRLLLGLAAVASVIALPIARAAAEVHRRSAWRVFGYNNQGDFVREHLQRHPRWLYEQVRLSAAIEKHPQLGEALCGADGGLPLGQVASIQIGRVATAETLASWIDRARALSLDELRAAVSAACRAQSENEASSTIDVDSAIGSQVGAEVGSEDVNPGRVVDSSAIRARATGRSIAMELEDEESDENRVLVRRIIPPDVKLIFDAGHELLRNLEGSEASLSAFVQALTGEAASAGIVPPDDFHPTLQRLSSVNRGRARSKPRVKSAGRGMSPSVRELRQWRALRTPAMRRARHSLVEFEQVRHRLVRLANKFPAWDACGSLGPDPSAIAKGKKRLPRAQVRVLRRLVGVLQSLERLERCIEIDMALLLLELHEHRAWEHLGYTGLESYVEGRLGLGGSMARQHVSLARALRRYPRVGEAYADRVIGFAATQWVTRTLRPTRGEPGLQALWVRRAMGQKVKRLRDESRGLERTRLEAQVAVAEAMTGRPGVHDANAKQNPSDESTATSRDSAAPRGPGVKQDPSITSTRSVDPGPSFERKVGGRSNARSNVPIGSAAAITRALAAIGMPMSDAAWLASLRRVPGETRSRAIALAQGLLGRVVRNGPLTESTLSLYLSADDAIAFLGCIEQARRMLDRNAEARLRPGEECQTFPSAKIAAEYVQRKRRVPDWVGLLALLEDWLWTHDNPKTMPDRPGYRQRALELAGFRCMAPGCTSRRNLQVHHLHYRGHQGGDWPWNVLVLCEFHHQQGEHGTLARFRGRAPLDVLCRLGDEAVGTWWKNERRIPRPSWAMVRVEE